MVDAPNNLILPQYFAPWDAIGSPAPGLYGYALNS